MQQATIKILIIVILTIIQMLSLRARQGINQRKAIYSR